MSMAVVCPFFEPAQRRSLGCREWSSREHQLIFQFNFFSLLTLLPRYFHSGTDAEFEEYFAFVRRVAMEDFELCEKAQENLEKGVYFEGILNPNKEQGVSFCKYLLVRLLSFTTLLLIIDVIGRFHP